MRKQLIYILLCLLPMQLRAHDYAALPTHAFVVWGNAGYLHLNNHSPMVTTLGGGAAEIGVGYELGRIRQGWLCQIGASIAPKVSKMQHTAFTDEKQMYDTEMQEHTAYFTFDNIQQKDVFVHANLHLLLGYKWRKGFYMMAGPKLGCVLYGEGHTTSLVTTTARYDGLIGNDGNGHFADMPNHFLHTVPRQYTQTLPSNPYIGLSVECGYAFRQKQSKAPAGADYANWRIALYGEVGSHRNRATHPAPLITNDERLTPNAYQPAVSNFLFYDQRHITQFAVGLKITYLLEYKSNHPCLLCR